MASDLLTANAASYALSIAEYGCPQLKIARMVLSYLVSTAPPLALSLDALDS